MAELKCPYCQKNIETKTIEIITEYNCPVCGHYYQYSDFYSGISLPEEYNDKTSSYLFYHKNNYDRFIGDNKDYEKVKKRFSKKIFSLITLDEIEAFWPKTFTDRITNILIWLDNHSKYPGETIHISYAEIQRLFFLNTNAQDFEINSQYRFYTDYLYHIKKYIDIFETDDGIDISLKHSGYERIEELQLENKNNKKVFVSMAFNDKTVNTREAIKNGIIEAKYDATLIDEIIHNKQIVPEMFRLIRESRLLVMDISEPNYGAYYEAGYAQGLGKEVIITCSEERFYMKYESEEEKKYEKYLKPHFDIAQKQILLWKDTDDLTKKLSEWIKAIE